MQQLAQAICFMLLNSLWQAGLLFVVYIICNATLLSHSFAKEKKHLVFGLLIAQMIFSVITFFTFFSSPTSSSFFNYSNNNLLNNWLIEILTNGFTILYFLVVIFKIITHLRQRRQFFKSQSVYKKPSVDIRLFTKATAHLLGINKHVTVWLSETITSPVTYGFLKPVILLPVALVNNISQQQAETLILHELAHIKANDYLQNFIIIIIGTIFFFNPFITGLCKKLKLEREKACDIEVINFDYPPVVYAEALFAVEKVKQNSLILFAVDNKHQLLKRILYFTQLKNANHHKLKLASTLIIAMLFFIAIGIFSINIKSRKINIASVNTIQTKVPLLKKDETISASINTKPVKELNTITKKANFVKRNNPIALNKVEPKPETFRILEKENEVYEIYPTAQFQNHATSEVIIEEEVSGSKNKTLKVFQIKFNGKKWLLIPVLKIDAKEKNRDTNFIKKDSLIISDGFESNSN